MNRLRRLIKEPSTGIGAIASYLDGLDHGRRMKALSTTTRSDQRLLWVKAAQSSPLTLEHFLPDTAGPLVPVVHHGRNTLPLPRPQKFFRKPMARPEDGSPRAFGYNDAPSRKLIGPGYFVLIETAGESSVWEERGAWVVDYLQHPDGRVPLPWPEVRSNREGLQRFVYHGTRDFMRKVSDHVSIGAAYKAEKALDHYFTLCRED